MNNPLCVQVSLTKDEKDTIQSFQNEFKPTFDKYWNFKKDSHFFIAPDTYLFILRILPKYFEQVKKVIHEDDALEEWELRNISAILGKSLIPDSIAPTKQNAKLLAEDVNKYFAKKSHILIRELCTGAGLSTTLSWMEIQKHNPDKHMTIISTDNALESIVVSSIILSIFDIPNIITSQKITKDNLTFDGVVLQHKDAVRAVEEDLGNQIKYDLIFSDHGVSYFPNIIHSTIMKNTVEIMNSTSCLYVCGLEPSVRVNLDYPFMIKEILFGKGNRKETYTRLRKERVIEIKEGKRNGSTAFYDTQRSNDGKLLVKALLTDESGGLYDMLNSFLKSFKLKKFVQYIKMIISVVKTTKELGGEVQSPVSYTAKIIKELKNPKLSFEIIPKIEEGERIARTIKIQNS